MRLGENPIIYLSRKMWHNSQNKKRVALYFAMSWLSNLVNLCTPLIFALLLNELQINGVTDKNFYYLLFLSFLFVARCLATWAFHGPSRMLENDNAFTARARYKTSFLGGVLVLPLEWHNEHHSGDTNDKLEKGSAGLFGFAESAFRVVGIINSMIVSFIILLFFDVDGGLITLMMILITISIIVKFDTRLTPLYQTLNGKENKIAEKILDVITNINTVVILRIKKVLLKSMSEKIIEPRDLFWKTNRLEETKWFLVSLCTNIMIFSVIGYHLYKVYFGLPLVLGTFFALYGYTNSVADNFFDFAGFYGDLLKNKARLLNAEELASEFKPVKNGANGNEKYNWQELQIKSLNFSYHGEKEEADLHLDDVSFGIKRGDKIALIGATGSGKTTLLKVIRELYQPQTAKVCLDSKELPEGFGSISSQIALIPQDPEIFAATILENITAGVEYDMKTVRKYTDMARFTKVALRLPRKFDSLITERGVNLSGGEKQRLALARGLLASEDKSIVLLDEPTSSVDVSTELAIYQNIFQAFPDKAVISSLHKLHLLPMFDRIYLFENGRIIAGGTFEELLQNSDEFQDMWNKYRSATEEPQNPA